MFPYKPKTLIYVIMQAFNAGVEGHVGSFLTMATSPYLKAFYRMLQNCSAKIEGIFVLSKLFNDFNIVGRFRVAK